MDGAEHARLIGSHESRGDYAEEREKRESGDNYCQDSRDQARTARSRPHDYAEPGKYHAKYCRRV